MLQRHMESSAKNATYLSPDIQNGVLIAAGELVREKAVHRVKAAQFWSLLADKTTDRHHREQLTVVARYVRPDDQGHWHCYNSITRSEFVVSLVILENISGLMLPTTRSLQKVGSDFVQAMHDIGDMISSLQSLRTQDGFHKLFQEASSVAETLLDCDIKKPRTAYRSVYRAAAAATAEDTAEDYYRINVFYPAVDSILRDLELRFGPKQQMSMSLSHLIPAVMPAEFNEEETEAAWKQLESGIAVYSDFLTDPTPAMKSEFFLWRRKWQKVPADDRPKSALLALDHCGQFLNMKYAAPAARNASDHNCRSRTCVLEDGEKCNGNSSSNGRESA